MKHNEHEVLHWEHPAVYRYEQTIPLKIPGYASLYEITNRLLDTGIKEESTADILVVGAGGGQECVVLGAGRGNRRLTGVDPSERMLEIAASRVEKADLKQRVTLIQGSVESLPLDRFSKRQPACLCCTLYKGCQQSSNCCAGLQSG